MPDTLARLRDELYLYMDSIKARDPKDPARVLKAKMEVRLTRLLKKQLTATREKLARWLPTATVTKAVTIPPGILDFENEFESELIYLFVIAFSQGVNVLVDTIPFVFDLTGINTRALEWAKVHAGELIKGVTDTLKQAVQDAVSAFITEPGTTIGDLSEMILDKVLIPAERAEMIAVTETTNAFAQGELAYAEELQRKYPGSKIIKTWFTNVDERVCPICGELHGQTVPVDEPFTALGEEYDTPPAHPRCRCWQNVTIASE